MTNHAIIFIERDIFSAVAAAAVLLIQAVE
jgi:hypothetical protein